MATNSCTCLDSPNMLAGPCRACCDEGLKVEMPSDWKMPVSPCLNSDSGACSVLDANGRSVARQLWCNEAKAIAYALNQVYTRIPPAQAEPVEPRQPCTCTGSCKGEEGLGKTWCCVLKKNMVDDGMSHGKLFRAQAEPVAVCEWKPVAGERVLVEAVVTEVSEDDGDCWLDMPRDQFGRFLLTELRPLPVVQGEGEGK